MKTIIIYSGGLDSTVLLYYLKEELGMEIHALSIDYGQRHGRELFAGEAICEEIEVDYKRIGILGVRELLAGSALTDNIEVPEGHYADENMKLTVVPNRNMLLLSLATAWAVSLKAHAVAYAAHAGDHAIYPDCRLEFTDAMAEAMRLCDWHEVHLLRPFIGMHKHDIVKVGADLNVPFEKTWSCYKGHRLHCGKCGTCVERKEAFNFANIEDPTEYAG
jgi:7-cyano-7-deazaguanine synthase